MDKTAKFLKKTLEELDFNFKALDKVACSGILDSMYYRDLVEMSIKSLSEVASLGDWELLAVVMLLKRWYKKRLEEAGEEKPADWQEDPEGSYY